MRIMVINNQVQMLSIKPQIKIMIIPGGVLCHNEVGKDENHGVAREDPVSTVNMLPNNMVWQMSFMVWRISSMV